MIFNLKFFFFILFTLFFVWEFEINVFNVEVNILFLLLVFLTRSSCFVLQRHSIYIYTALSIISLQFKLFPFNKIRISIVECFNFILRSLIIKLNILKVPWTLELYAKKESTISPRRHTFGNSCLHKVRITVHTSSGVMKPESSFELQVALTNSVNCLKSERAFVASNLLLARGTLNYLERNSIIVTP